MLLTSASFQSCALKTSCHVEKAASKSHMMGSAFSNPTTRARLANQFQVCVCLFYFYDTFLSLSLRLWSPVTQLVTGVVMTTFDLRSQEDVNPCAQYWTSKHIKARFADSA